MNKLELKYLAPYPMGINGIKLFREKSGRIDTLYGLQTTSSGNLLVCIDECDWRKNDYWNFKPIIRPLSDLVKPCLPEGKIPIVELAKIEGFTPMPYTIESKNGTFVLYGDWFCHPMEQSPKARFFFEIDTDNCSIDRGLEYIDESVDTVFCPCSNQLALFEWLFEHHFDVFGLIEQDLAIDINTIEK